MDTNLSLFNQINSLAYWFLTETTYKSCVRLDPDNDTFFVSLKSGGQAIFSYDIANFSKKNKRFLQFELNSIVHNLLYIKQHRPTTLSA
ncbi:MAG: hypothetical protein R3213_06510 [Flavobacteriaceae bacterium]|nr:hypothetical protein [Flavobacteriaceae bacterium]